MGFLHKVLKKIQRAKDTAVADTSSRVIAVDIGQSHFLVLSAEKGEKINISDFHLEPRPSGPEAISNRIKTLFTEKKLESENVRTLLKSSGMIVRILKFPQMKRQELTSMLQFEVEKYIPFKTNEVILDFDVLEEEIEEAGKKQMEILLVAVKRSEVYEAHQLFEKAGIQVAMINIGAASLINMIEFLSPEIRNQTTAFLEMGAESTTFGILLKGKPVFIRDISFGGTDIRKMVKRKLGSELDTMPGKMTAEYKAAVEQSLSGLFNELKLSLGYYNDRIPGAQTIETLYVAGGGFRLIPDLHSIEMQLKIPVVRPQLSSKIEVNPHIDPAFIKQNEDLLLPALGLCL